MQEPAEARILLVSSDLEQVRRQVVVGRLVSDARVLKLIEVVGPRAARLQQRHYARDRQAGDPNPQPEGTRHSVPLYTADPA